MSVASVGVIGAGIMGSGIAQVCASAGLDVVMIDVNQAALDRGLSHIDKSLARFVKKGTLTAEAKDAALSRLSLSTDYADLKSLPLIIEAATENLGLKEKILKAIDDVVAPDAIIATNTSSISITQLAAANSHPGRVIGMHFFNPPPLMPLIEIINGLQTSPETLEKVSALVARIGKKSITVKNNPGFVVNRILIPMINEAFFTLSEGIATAEEIDLGMVLGCNQPIGPLALGDMIGLDTCLAILDVFFENFNDSKYRPCPMLRELVAAGRLGRKSGHGVYQYN